MGKVRVKENIEAEEDWKYKGPKVIFVKQKKKADEAEAGKLEGIRDTVGDKWRWGGGFWWFRAFVGH